MENLNHYFSDAEENISNEFMSANGESVVFVLSADELDAYGQRFV